MTFPSDTYQRQHQHHQLRKKRKRATQELPDGSKTSENEPASRFTLLNELPLALVEQSLLTYLTVQDLRSLESTSHASAKLVDHYRGPLPYIFREQLLPHKMSYINFRRGWRMPGDPFDVHSAQTVRFLLRTERHGIVHLEFCLTEYLWTESEGIQRYYGLATEDRCVWVEVKIFRKKKDGTFERFYENTPPPRHPNTGDPCASYFLENYETNPSDTTMYFFRREEFRRKQRMLDTLEVPARVEENQQSCVDYIWLCVKQLTSFPPKYNLPNLQYILISCLAKELYKFLPPHFQIDPNDAVGPAIFPRWKQRFPRSPLEWHTFIWAGNNQHDQYGQLKKDFYIYDIPWYSEWYPRPVILNPKDMLRTLPVDITRKSILPFLSEQSVHALHMACPGMELHE